MEGINGHGRGSGRVETTAAAKKWMPISTLKRKCSNSVTKSLGSSSMMKALAESYELQKVITKALVLVGAGDLKECKEESKIIQEGLATFYIKTTQQLREALEPDGEVLAQIISAGFIKGRLVNVLRDVLKESDVKAVWKRVAMSLSKPQRALNKPLLRKLDVIHVDLTNISEINQIDQTFYARVFLILRMKNGKFDRDLVRDFDGFPFDDYGKPTFRPSAKWYLNQLDFPNAKSIRTLESKVTTEGDHIHLIKRVEGYFNHRFDLHDFPFDQQDLTVVVSSHCAVESSVPVKFHVPTLHLDDDQPAHLGVDTANFTHSDVWDIFPKITTMTSTLGASSSHRLPTVSLTVNVQRKSQFIKLNAAVPCSCISLLSLASFFVPVELIAARLDLAITILLTAVAFRFTTNSYLPMISYMTIIDKFTLMCTGVIVFAFFSHSFLGMMDYWTDVSAEFLEVLNQAFFGSFVLVWLVVQFWFLTEQSMVTRRNSKSRAQKMQTIKEDGERICSRKNNSLDRQSTTAWKRASSLGDVETLSIENSCEIDKESQRLEIH